MKNQTQVIPTVRDIIKNAPGLAIGERMTVEHNGRGLFLYAESIRGRRQYRVIGWVQVGHRERRVVLNRQHFTLTGTIDDSLYAAYELMGLDPADYC